MKRSSLLLLLVVLSVGCQKEKPIGEPGKKGMPITIGFDLTQPQADASRLAGMTKSGDEAARLRFRLLSEIKSSDADTVYRDTALMEITTSNVTLKDTLPYGHYTLAVWGNYVWIDPATGQVVDEQYSADPEKGLSDIRILHPEQEKNWGFAYAGTKEFTVSSSTSQLQIPISRCVMQIQFIRDAQSEDYEWRNVVASNITLTGFSTHYNVYSAEATVDSIDPVIQLTDIDNRECYYYRLTLFETLQDCYIDLQYINMDGSTYDFPQFYNQRQVYNRYDESPQYKPMFERNKLLFFGYRFDVEDEPFTTAGWYYYDLMGDETIFESAVFSHVAQQDSLALVDLYHALNGEHWAHQWRLAMPVSTWAGVILSPRVSDEPQRVIGLNLTTQDGDLWGANVNNLRGYIPESLGKLTELTELVIAAELTDSEDFLSGLTQLKILSICNNRLASYGGISGHPKVKLSDKLTQLEYVKLDGGLTIENLNVLWQNKNLQQVNISDVVLSNDTEIMKTADVPLERLKSLGLNYIKGATAVSDNIYKLGSQLSELNFFSVTGKNDDEYVNIDLATLIDAYPNMTRTNLTLYDQQIPSSIGSWKRLNFLNLMGDLYGNLPNELFELPNLQTLWFQNCPRLTGVIPAEWANANGRYVSIRECDGITIR